MSDYLEELKAYTNKEGFIGPTPCAGLGRICDNHLLFTAEAYLVGDRINTGTDWTIIYRMKFLQDKFNLPNGWFSRYPGDPGYDLSPDNLLGYLTLCTKEQAQALLDYATLYDGNIQIYTPTWTQWGASFIFRQPQLLCATLAKAGKLSRFNPLHWLLTLYTAGVILVAGMGEDPCQDQDSRRLSYMLIKIVQDYSLLCTLASKVWWGRLKKQYGMEGLRLMYSRYFSPEHPIARYAKNVWDQRK